MTSAAVDKCKKGMLALSGACMLSLLLAIPPAYAKGPLLIVGGALKEGNAEVHKALIGAMLPEGPMVIIPAASGRPSRSAEAFTDSLVQHGLNRDRIVVFPLAVKDDSGTEDVDESSWRQNAWSEDHVKTVHNAAGFWFTGGDQTRITNTMLGEDDEESPFLLLIRQRLDAGAVVGGSSAGAAIMSHDMIAGGISFTALLEPLSGAFAETEDQDSGRLYLSTGLGFLDTGIVDQHFDRKTRLGRLVRAMAATGQARGIGIDENTALLVHADEDLAEVLGSGSVTLLDASEARFGFKSQNLASGLSLSLIASGVQFRVSDFAVLGGQGEATVGNEYFSYAPLQGGGMAFSNPMLEQALGFDLLDNSASSKLDRYSIDSKGRVIVYRFSQTQNSAGYWRSEGSGDRYSISAVRFDILSLQTKLPDH